MLVVLVYEIRRLAGPFANMPCSFVFVCVRLIAFIGDTDNDTDRRLDYDGPDREH